MWKKFPQKKFHTEKRDEFWKACKKSCVDKINLDCDCLRNFFFNMFKIFLILQTTTAEAFLNALNRIKAN